MTAREVYVFENGNVAVFDENGQQMSDAQGSWINFEYLKELAQLIVKDNAVIKGVDPGNYLMSYVEYYRKVNTHGGG